MNRSTRVVGVAVLVSASVAAVLQVAALQSDGSRTALIQSVTTLHGVGNMATIFVFAVIPAFLPMTLLGGMLAARVLRRDAEPRSLPSWAWLGCASGACLGAVGSTAWFGALNLGEQEALTVVAFVASMGGAAGAVVGSIVGAYCWCLSRRAGGPIAEASTMRTT